MAEIVEVVEHQVHVLLLFALQVMDDSLVLVHFDTNVSIGLPGYGSRLDEVASLLIHVIAALSR